MTGTPPRRGAQPALHPELGPGERRTLFEAGIRLFNDRRFFACHEAWEKIWRSTTPEPKDLFLAPESHGLDLAALIAAVEAWEAWLEEPRGEPPPVPRLDVVDPAS